MSVHRSGRLDKRVVGPMGRVAWKGCLKRWAIAHRGDARLFSTATAIRKRGGLQSDSGTRVVEVPRIVDILECDGHRSQEGKVRGVRGTQFLRSGEGVDEEGCAAVHAIAQAVQYLEAWRTSEVPV